MIFSKKFLFLALFLVVVCQRVAANPSSNQVDDEQEYDDDDQSAVLKQAAGSIEPKAETLASEQNESPQKPFTFPKKVVTEGEPVIPKSILQILAAVNWSEFWVEFLLLLSVVGYYSFYLLGSSTNEKLAKSWLKKSLEFFTSQFSQMGDDRGFFLMRNSANDFIFYASGRTSCNFMYGHLHLYPRHDLFQIIYSLYKPTYDHVEVQFQLPESSMDGVFGVVPRSLANDLRKGRFDVNTFTKQSAGAGLPDDLVVVSEHGDITRSILTPQLISKIKEAKDNFEGFVVSDQPREKPENLKFSTHHVVSLKYRFTDPEQLPALHRLSLAIVDQLSGLELRSDLKSKLAKNREEAYYDLHKEEQDRVKEELEEKLNEKRRKELELRDKLSPAAQRKLEQKEARKKSKKQAAKMTIKK